MLLYIESALGFSSILDIHYAIDGIEVNVNIIFREYLGRLKQN